jgi:hypothetical protein
MFDPNMRQCTGVSINPELRDRILDVEADVPAYEMDQVNNGRNLKPLGAAMAPP